MIFCVLQFDTLQKADKALVDTAGHLAGLPYHRHVSAMSHSFIIIILLPRAKRQVAQELPSDKCNHQSTGPEDVL